MSSEDDDDQEYKSWVTTVLYVSAAVSCLCSLFVVVSYVRFPVLRKRAFKLVFYLAISDGGANAALLLGDSPGWHCVTQGIMQQFFSTAAILWSFVIALTMYGAVVLRAMRDKGETSLIVAFTESPWLVHCFVWGLSLMVTLPPLLIPRRVDDDDERDDDDNGFRYYGDSDAWCWIVVDDEDAHMGTGDWLRFATFYFIVWIAFITSTFCYCAVYLSLKRVIRQHQGSPKDAQTDVLLRLMRTLKYYPLIFFISWLPNSTLRVLESKHAGSAHDQRTVWALLYGPAVQGVLDAIAYGFTPAVRQEWKKLVKRIFRDGSLTPLCFGESDFNEGVGSNGVGGGGGGGGRGGSSGSSRSRGRGRGTEPLLSQEETDDSITVVGSSLHSGSGGHRAGVSSSDGRTMSGQSSHHSGSGTSGTSDERAVRHGGGDYYFTSSQQRGSEDSSLRLPPSERLPSPTDGSGESRNSGFAAAAGSAGALLEHHGNLRDGAGNSRGTAASGGSLVGDRGSSNSRRHVSTGSGTSASVSSGTSRYSSARSTLPPVLVGLDGSVEHQQRSSTAGSVRYSALSRPSGGTERGTIAIAEFTDEFEFNGDDSLCYDDGYRDYNHLSPPVVGQDHFGQPRGSSVSRHGGSTSTERNSSGLRESSLNDSQHRGSNASSGVSLKGMKMGSDLPAQ